MTTDHLTSHVNGHLEIRTSNYISQVDKISDNLLYLKREHHYSGTFKTVDTFGDFNLLALANLKEGSVTVSQGGQSCELSGPLALFIPKYSVVKWTVNAAVLQWSSYITNQALSDTLSTVSLFETGYFETQSIEDLKKHISNARLKFSFKDVESSFLPKQIKDYLDQNQFEAMEISQLAERFNLTPSQVTKLFKKFYGITPVEYRSKVRIFNSMFNLLNSEEKTDVTKIAFGSGFSDLSRFNKQFKKITRTTPSKFKFRTKE